MCIFHVAQRAEVRSSTLQEKIRICIILGSLVLLGACNITLLPKESENTGEHLYTDPAHSGLLAGNPFPNEGDVCVSLNSNSVTEPLEVEDHFLIACPKHEIGAIQDRESQHNAKIVGSADDWVVLSLPTT